MKSNKTKLLKSFLLLLPFYLMLVGVACKKEDSSCACGVENPQENLDWLDHLLQKRFYTEVYSIQYQGQEYIGVYDRPKSPDGGAVIYDCQGEKICEYIGITGQWTCDEAFKNALNNKELIYKQETNHYWE